MEKSKTYNKKKILVIGLGISGLAAANLLKRKGAEVTVADIMNRRRLAGNIKKLNAGIKLIPGNGVSYGKGIKIDSYEVIVASPGIPHDDKLLKAAKEGAVPVTGEIELACGMLPAGTGIVAITGTNGKSTTVELTRAVLRSRKNRRVIAAGNIGLPLSTCLGRVNDDTDLVLEVSSYQLETVNTFHPVVSVILNITPDHIEHHGTMSGYIKAKANIFKNQVKSDYCILNADDRHCMKLAEKVISRKVLFSVKKKLKKGVYLENGRIICDTGYARRAVYRLSGGFVKIPGIHNLQNIMVVIAAGGIMGTSRPGIEAAIRSFKGIEHRIEKVRSLKKISYINDSKATNVDSCQTALDTFPPGIILIMGGKDKGAPYSPLGKSIRKKVSGLIVFGEAASRIKEDLGNTTGLYMVNNLKEAVKLANSLAVAGNTVLFSPACSSFDQFRNFEERGREFKKWVRKLG